MQMSHFVERCWMPLHIRNKNTTPILAHVFFIATNTAVEYTSCASCPKGKLQSTTKIAPWYFFVTSLAGLLCLVVDSTIEELLLLTLNL